MNVAHFELVASQPPRRLASCRGRLEPPESENKRLPVLTHSPGTKMSMYRSQGSRFRKKISPDNILKAELYYSKNYHIFVYQIGHLHHKRSIWSQCTAPPCLPWCAPRLMSLLRTPVCPRRAARCSAVCPDSSRARSDAPDDSSSSVSLEQSQSQGTLPSWTFSGNCIGYILCGTFSVFGCPLLRMRA